MDLFILNYLLFSRTNNNLFALSARTAECTDCTSTKVKNLPQQVFCI